MVTVVSNEIFTLALDKKEFGAFSSVDDGNKLTNLKAISSESHGIFASGDMLISANSNLNAASEEQSSVETTTQSDINQEQVLGMKIDASKVSYDDIEKYEKLMLGAVTLASSNSNHKVGKASE